MRIVPQTLVGRMGMAFLVPSTVVLILMVVLSYGQARRALRASVETHLETLVTVKEAALETWVDDHLRAIEFLASLPHMVDGTRELIDQNPNGGSAIEPTATSVRMTALLLGAQVYHPSLQEVFLLSRSGGQVLASTDPTNVGEYRIYSAYYTQGKLGPFVQNVYPSPDTLEPTLTLSSPIRSADGALEGVLAAHLSLEYLDQNILQRVGLGRSGLVTLVDGQKVVVTGRHYGESATNDRVGSRAIDAVVAGQNGTAHYPNPRNLEVIGSYRWIEDKALGLIVEVEQQEAFEPARRLAITVALTGGLFLAALIATVYLVALHIARPVLELRDVAVRVGEGNFDHRAQGTGQNEIGTLARAFNRMIDQLAVDHEVREKARQEREALIADLETKNAELEQFTYTVSHDLKSPLVTIKGFLGMVVRDLERQEYGRMGRDLARIDRATDKMHQLLEELLELSRIGRVANPPETIDFGDLTRDALTSVADDDTAGLVHIADGLPSVVGDRVRLREVLENLLSNALKFMGDQPHPRVEVGCDIHREEVVFHVRDNGQGIDAPYLEKVFGLFERLHVDVDGTGVGLAIVRRIIEIHGGRIWVESAGAGQGSTFYFTIPGSNDLPSG